MIAAITLRSEFLFPVGRRIRRRPEFHEAYGTIAAQTVVFQRRCYEVDWDGSKSWRRDPVDADWLEDVAELVDPEPEPVVLSRWCMYRTSDGALMPAGERSPLGETGRLAGELRSWSDGRTTWHEADGAEQ